MSNGKSLKAVAYGEVLWDVFTNEKKIGGAPIRVDLLKNKLMEKIVLDTNLLRFHVL